PRLAGGVRSPCPGRAEMKRGASLSPVSAPSLSPFCSRPVFSGPRPCHPLLSSGSFYTRGVPRFGWVRTLMFGVRGEVLVVAPLLVSAAGAAAGERPAGKAPAAPDSARQPRTDLSGAPLPPGALARLGTVRWRHGRTVEFTAYLPDGKRLLTAS